MTAAESETPSRVIVVGASAGGVEALRQLVSVLPADLPAAVLVVLHVPVSGGSALPTILDRAGALPVRHAVDGDRLRSGEVLVAPPDHHLVVVDGTVALTRGPTENGHRPAIDVLFRTAARSYGSRTLGVVLSGSLDDGAAGAVAIAERGGACVVQDYDEALYDSMPRAAAAAGGVQAATPVAAMPRAIADWVASAPSPVRPTPDLMETESAMAELDPDVMHHPDRPGDPAGFGCPDCAGGLFAIEEGPLKRYRCRVGHAWSPQSLLARQTVALESALWMALRSLEEKAALAGELGLRAEGHEQPHAAARMAASADEARRAAELVRQLLTEIGDAVTSDDPDGDVS
jgi:two-component system, chemotaxis family, protein-glutamate methylesterase/glutaminase